MRLLKTKNRQGLRIGAERWLVFAESYPRPELQLSGELIDRDQDEPVDKQDVEIHVLGIIPAKNSLDLPDASDLAPIMAGHHERQVEMATYQQRVLGAAIVRREMYLGEDTWLPVDDAPVRDVAALSLGRW